MQNNRPIYLQIADQISEAILQGKYIPGERIPSVREMAADQQVNSNTVVRSFESLERDGIIFNRRGLGFFVSPDAVEKITEARREEFYKGGEMDYMFSRLRALGLTPESLAALYCKYLTK